MMFKILAVFAVLATTYAQNGEVTSTIPCRENGRDGECVPYYLCNPDNNEINTDGTDIIDIRFDDTAACPNYMLMCCHLSNKRDEPLLPEHSTAKREGCGWRNPEGADMKTTGDVNGESKFGEFPWMVIVLKIEPKDKNFPDGEKQIVFCGGGSLIHPSVVLTTAHHVANTKELLVRAGDWDTQIETEIYPYQERMVDRMIIHKDFNPGNLYYDIAMLFLKRPMDLAPNVGIACLPPPSQSPVYEPPTPGTRCFAAGWGKDKFGKHYHYQNILKKVEVPVVSHSDCQAALRRTRLRNNFELHTSFMCAGGEAGGDTCTGDGGSPLVCPIPNEEGRYVQTGMVAWGIGCGDNGVPGVYVDVANLRSWIDDKVKGQGYQDSSSYGFSYAYTIDH